MTVQEGVLEYIKWKQANGYRFDRGAVTLKRFERDLPGVRIEEVNPEHILRFLNRSNTAAITWRNRYWVLHRLFQHWSARGMMCELMMPALRPSVRQTHTPYIYTTGELRAILNANSEHHDYRLAIHALTFKTIFLLLYGTGAAVGEINSILLSDLYISDEFIEIRSTRPNRSRQLPIGSDVRVILESYMKSRLQAQHVSPYLFVTKRGRPISCQLISLTFRRLRKLSGICRFDGSTYQPRIDDLRYTFAVHRITKWIEQGADLNRMLPALAAYMGQVGLGSTERYLFLTPERFRKDLDRLSPSRGRGNWNKDTELLKFLASL